MPSEAGYCIFVAIMTVLSIPIIALLKWKPKNKDYDRKLEEIETRLRDLEGRGINATMEIESLKKDVAFTNRLITK